MRIHGTDTGRRPRCGMALLILWLAAWGAPPAGAAPAAKNSCVTCHRELEPELAHPIAEFERSVHAARGLDCTACHGGDPRDEDITAMDPDKGFKGRPTRDEIAALCASCHADAAYMKRYDPQPYVFSLAEWKTSVHCKLESEGDRKVATCTGCHGVHDIRSPDDPASPVYPTNVPRTCAACHNPEYLKGRPGPADQFEKYKGSVHGVALLEKGDLSAPACNDCHGNHGAAPPGVRHVTNVCGACHGRVAELFEGSPMKPAMDEAGMPGCVTCHGNHGIQPPTDDWISTAEDGACGDCHEPGSAADRATRSIIAAFRGLDASIAATDSLLQRAEVLGMATEHGRGMLREASDQVIAARATLHSFDEERIIAVTTAGAELSDRARAAAEAALRDWRNRRIGMGISVVVILLLMALLVARIRAMERGAASDVA